MAATLLLVFVTILAHASTVNCKVLNFETDLGAIPDDSSVSTIWENGRILNETLNNFGSGNTLYIPAKTFVVMGGILVKDLTSTTLHIDGTLQFAKYSADWPKRTTGEVRACIEFVNSKNITFTSTAYGSGVIDGNGPSWWDIPFLGYVKHLENRPFLLYVRGSKDVLVENLLFKRSPFWTSLFEDANGLEIRNSAVLNRRTPLNDHGLVDLSALNTDGFDVTGRNIWIHDVTIWTQDDCIALKDGVSNVLVERVNASCLGLAIGSIGNSHNSNITFRDIIMHKSLKPIYLKFRNEDPVEYDPLKPCPCAYERMEYGLIENILFENIIINEPATWPVWLGPAQQTNVRYVNSFVLNTNCDSSSGIRHHAVLRGQSSLPQLVSDSLTESTEISFLEMSQLFSHFFLLG